MGLKGPKLIPFWCLMPKGEKIRPKQEMDQLPLENFENSRIELLLCQNPLIVFYSYLKILVRQWGLGAKK